VRDIDSRCFGKGSGLSNHTEEPTQEISGRKQKENRFSFFKEQAEKAQTVPQLFHKLEVLLESAFPCL
jgi:hypothetical protein